MGLPKLLFFALIAGAGWYFYRKFVRDAEKLAASHERKRQENKNGAQGTLVQDPKTGEYRLKKIEDA